MATPGSNGNLVETVEVPENLQELYRQACQDDLFLAQSLAIPGNRRSTTMLVQGRGRELIGEIETLSLGNETRKLRGVNLSKVKPVVQVFFPGDNVLGQPYMVIIPFFISGRVTLESEEIHLDHYYHVYGDCHLRVISEQNEEGKLGVWAYMLSN